MTETRDFSGQTGAFPAHKVKKDNSNLYKYNSDLSNAIKNKSSRYSSYCIIDQIDDEMLEEVCGYSEDQGIDILMDFKEFSKRLSDRDSTILYLYLFSNETNQDIADAVGLSRQWVHYVLKRLTKSFARFYIPS
jgi:DNA-directed RNA polymerase specialized sigma subunit